MTHCDPQDAASNTSSLSPAVAASDNLNITLPHAITKPLAAAMTSTTTSTGADAAASQTAQQPIRPTAATVATKETAIARKWNTESIGLRLGADLLSAACAGALVAPIVTMIDRSIMENASGRATLGDSIKASLRTLLTRPHSFLFSKPAALIFCLYGGTYLTANTLDTVSSTVQNRPATTVTHGTTKFAATSATNIGICVYKDQVFVRMFGAPGQIPRPVPRASSLLFAVRDCITIFSSFNLPPLLGPVLDQHLTTTIQKAVSGTTMAQFATPAAVQVLSTPLHLLGLDLYNRSHSSGHGSIPWRDRWDAVRKNWAISCVARIARIVPAYGCGGVVNTKIRRNLMERLV